MDKMIEDRIKQAHDRGEAKVELSIDEAERLVLELRKKPSGPAALRATREHSDVG